MFLEEWRRPLPESHFASRQWQFQQNDGDTRLIRADIRQWEMRKCRQVWPTIPRGSAKKGSKKIRQWLEHVCEPVGMIRVKGRYWWYRRDRRLTVRRESWEGDGTWILKPCSENFQTLASYKFQVSCGSSKYFSFINQYISFTPTIVMAQWRRKIHS